MIWYVTPTLIYFFFTIHLSMTPYLYSIHIFARFSARQIKTYQKKPAIAQSRLIHQSDKASLRSSCLRLPHTHTSWLCVLFSFTHVDDDDYSCEVFFFLPWAFPLKQRVSPSLSTTRYSALSHQTVSDAPQWWQPKHRLCIPSLSPRLELDWCRLLTGGCQWLWCLKWNMCKWRG